MITIIHGEDIVKSRNFFLQKKASVLNPHTFLADNLELADLIQIIEGSSLFDSSKSIFIEDFFTKKKSVSQEFKSITSYLNKKVNLIDLYFFEAKTLSKSQLNNFKNAKVETFLLPQELFKFLDSLFTKDKNLKIRLYHKVIENNEIELVFYMLLRQIRLLLFFKEESSQQIEEVKRLSPWQRKNLSLTSKTLSLTFLKSLHKKLYLLDLRNKSGKLALPLVKYLDFFLLEF